MGVGKLVIVNQENMVHVQKVVEYGRSFFGISKSPPPQNNKVGSAKSTQLEIYMCRDYVIWPVNFFMLHIIITFVAI